MSTLTVQPIQDRSEFGARVGGVNATTSSSLRFARRSMRSSSGTECWCSRTSSRRRRCTSRSAMCSARSRDHPSKAVSRAGGEDMLGVIELRHEPNQPGAVLVGGELLSQWLPWHFDHCYNDELNRRGCAPFRRRPTGRGADRVRRRRRALRRDLPRASGPDRRQDRDLRHGRDHGQPSIRPARWFRGRRGGSECCRRDDRIRGPAAGTPPCGLDSSLRGEGSPRLPLDGEGHRRPPGPRRRRPAGTRCATRSSRRRRTSATSTAGSRRTWSSGTTGACSTPCRGWHRNMRGACTARPSKVTTASAASKPYRGPDHPPERRSPPAQPTGARVPPTPKSRVSLLAAIARQAVAVPGRGAAHALIPPRHRSLVAVAVPRSRVSDRHRVGASRYRSGGRDRHSGGGRGPRTPDGVAASRCGPG